jgi:hypothetical protein
MLSIKRTIGSALVFALLVTSNCPGYAGGELQMEDRPNPFLGNGIGHGQAGCGVATRSALEILAWKDAQGGRGVATNRRPLGGVGGGGAGGSGSGGSGVGGGVGGQSGSGTGGKGVSQSSGAPGSNGVWQLGGGAGSSVHASTTQSTSTTNHINLSSGLVNGVGQSNKTGSLKNSIGTVEYRSGGDPTFVHKSPGGGGLNDVTLKRGLVNTSQLNSWRNSVVNSSKQNSWVPNNNKLPNLNGTGNEISIPEFNPNKNNLKIP